MDSRLIRFGLAWLAVAAGLASEPYRMALPDYRYTFPRDHFEHPEFRTEWWYYTGNLHDSAGRSFGFELVFFRQAQRRGPSVNPSAWRVDDLYLAHTAFTDVRGKRFTFRERLNRAGPGIAGASFEKRRVWNGNWSTQWQGDEQLLEVTTEDFRFRLTLRPGKPAVIHGAKGISQKAAGEGRASHYVSFTRLETEGEVRVGSARHKVTGAAWMDHEWFTHQLDPSQVGWDWFSVQLENRTELMLFRLRRADGSADPFSSGTYVDSSGQARHLSLSEFSLEPVRYWLSPRTKARYPVAWRIRVPGLGIALQCEAALEAQELSLGGPNRPIYWEGAVLYSGSVSGSGYLEMTGYDKPVQLN